MNKQFILFVAVFFLSAICNDTSSTMTNELPIIEQNYQSYEDYQIIKHEEKNKVLDYFNVEIDDKLKIFNKIDTIANRLSRHSSYEINPEWILISICKESRGNPQAVNPFTKATGIIQWLPSTAVDLNTSIDEIHKMSFYDQLDLVERYILRTGVIKYINSYEDFYLSIFFPRAVGKSDDYVIGRKNSKVVQYNHIMSNNGIITVKDFKNYARVTI